MNKHQAIIWSYDRHVQYMCSLAEKNGQGLKNVFGIFEQ